jgi:signal-transduction protein with cAMP-binding, CBS, and nucleotidyltransferase domain
MPVKPNKHLSQLLKKIPIFDGLSPTQIHKVLSICSHKSCEIDEVICSNNTPSDEMYILLT